MLQGWSLVLRVTNSLPHMPPFPSTAQSVLWEVWQTDPWHWEGLDSTTNLCYGLDMYPHRGRHYTKWSCKSVLSAKTDQRETLLSRTWHIPFLLELALDEHGWSTHASLGAFALGKGHPLITRKEETSAAHSWCQRKTKSNLGPFWVDEIPATFIIWKNRSPGDSWVLKHADFLPS